MTCFAFIFARGGSKGLLHKNIRSLAGKPLIAHSIDLAKQIPRISKVFVSTDSAEIAEVSRACGAEVIERPEHLARDDSPEWLAWQHAIQTLDDRRIQFEVFISLPATAPLRSCEDVEACLDCLDPGADAVITMTTAHRSPWFNMLRDRDGFVELLLSGEQRIVRRQDAPVAYDMTTVAFVTRPSFIRRATHIFDGRLRGVFVPEERAVDIDSEMDFMIAETLMKAVRA